MSEAIGQFAQSPNASQNGVISQLAQLPNDLLNLKEIAVRLGVTYDRLLGFANAPGVKELIGAVSVPGVKGVRYTSESEQLFSMLLAEQDQGLVQPASAAEFLSRTRALRENGQLAQSPNASQMGVNGQLGNFPIEALAEVLARAVQRIAPPPEDRLITAQEAADLLCCKPRSVKRFVLPVRPGVYKRSEILRYIQSL